MALKRGKAGGFLQRMKMSIRLSCTNSSGWPPIIQSLWYIFYIDGHFYRATQKSAKITEYLEVNPRCAFEIMVVAIDTLPNREVPESMELPDWTI